MAEVGPRSEDIRFKFFIKAVAVSCVGDRIALNRDELVRVTEREDPVDGGSDVAAQLEAREDEVAE